MSDEDKKTPTSSRTWNISEISTTIKKILARILA